MGLIYRLIVLLFISIGILLFSNKAHAVDIIETNFTDNTLGAYEVDRDRIYIQRGLSKDLRQYVMDHEMAHHSWYHDLTEIQRRLYCRRFDRGRLPTPTEHSKTSCEENYAERKAVRLQLERKLKKLFNIN